MSFAQIFLLYLISMALAAMLDFFWTGAVSRRLCAPPDETPVDIRTTSAFILVFHTVYAAGLMIFVIAPAYDRGPDSMGYAAGTGIFFGLLVYGACALRGLVFGREWSWPAALSDIAGGGLIGGLSGAVIFYLSQIVT
ncbi:MAG: DUF2177 family protein [Dehalococcoidia bacterium]|nr:DUF2177 family protein [Dehalococcoidia bacterium]